MHQSPTIKTLRILVVEDSADTAESLRTLVSAWGHEARIAPDGPAALDAVCDFLPDVVLLDIGLPGMDGWDVAARMRQAPELARCVLIVLSGFAAENDVQRSRAVGCACHLIKPANPDELRRMLTCIAITRSLES
jgi:two-component system, chemotaxis family, CheB/CheR fusion protein